MCDLLPSVYPSSKQVKPKPNTAMRLSRDRIYNPKRLMMFQKNMLHLGNYIIRILGKI